MYELGHLAGLRLTAKPSAIVGSLALWALLSAIGLWVELAPTAAVLGGLVALALHWLGELVHQFGHAWAARRAGHPMLGIAFWGLLSTSVYPRDEPELPAGVHIRRALGGPIASLALTLLALPIAWLLWPGGGAPAWVALFFALENGLIYTAQVLVPLGFNDGGTILHWWGRR